MKLYVDTSYSTSWEDLNVIDTKKELDVPEGTMIYEVTDKIKADLKEYIKTLEGYSPRWSTLCMFYIKQDKFFYKIEDEPRSPRRYTSVEIPCAEPNTWKYKTVKNY